MAAPKKTAAANEKAPRKSECSSLSDFTSAVVFISPSLAKSGGIGKKKVSAYNKFMQTELARLKESEPNTPHLERLITNQTIIFIVTHGSRRFRQATQNWKHAKENPKAA
jgi:hypothetical protein